METMIKPSATGLTDAIDIGFIDTANAEFYQTGGGFTGLRYNGEDYKRIALRRAMPIDNPTRYISVADHENKEICVIRDISDLSGEQARIVERELERRYYCPEVLEILSVKDKMGYVYIEMRIRGNGGETEKQCAVRDVNKNIRMLDEERLIIFDVDGNRYLVKSLHGLDKKSLKKLEPYLF